MENPLKPQNETPRNVDELRQEMTVSSGKPVDSLKKNQIVIEDYRQYLEAIIHCVPTPLLVLDHEMRVKMANECFYRTFEALPELTENLLIHELGNGQWNVPALLDLFEKILPAGEKFAHFEITHKFEKVGDRIMLLNARQIGEIPVILLNIEDITDQKSKEAELKKMNSELQRHGAQLRTVNTELEHFAAVASHDLQAPLHNISCFMGLLAKGYKDQLDPQAQEYIKIAEETAVRAQNLIRSLLSYAKIDTEKKNRNSVKMNAIVEQALIDMRSQIDESCAKFICGVLPEISGDEIQLRRLMQNLISNAVKYRSERPLEVSISAEENDSAWIFKVSDNGLGFDPKDKENIFDMFKRLHGESIPGVGIGLATCKKIMERHEGKIWAESEKGKGTVFYFSIPKG